MPALLQKALEKAGGLPDDEQDAIASQILESLDDEDAWKNRFVEKRDVLRRMAREALEEDARGARPFPWSIYFDPVEDDAALLAFVRRVAAGGTAGSQVRLLSFSGPPPQAAFQETGRPGRCLPGSYWTRLPGAPVVHPFQRV